MPDETQSNEPTVYPSHAKAGIGVIEIPIMKPVVGEGLYSRSAMQPLGANQPGAVERIQPAAFGNHVIQQIESDFKYRGPRAASARLAHYTQHGENSLLDAWSARQMNSFVKNMPKSADPQKYFRETVAPFLRGLTPKAR
jgi:hypothetical protein